MLTSEKRKRPRGRRGGGRSRMAITVGRELSGWQSDPLAAVFGRLAPNPDRTLEEHSGEGLQLYNEMLRKDSQLALCFRLRALNVTAQGWRVAPGGESRADLELADWVGRVLEDVEGFHLSRGQFFRGVSHGFAPAEIMFEARPEGCVGIVGFRNRDPERFRFDREGNLVLVGLAGADEKAMPRDKFILNTWGADETPYGRGLLAQLYPLWYFKNNAVKELVRFIEKFGAPYLWANYPLGTSGTEQDALLGVLQRMQGNSVGIGPEGTEIKITEVGRAGVIEVFRFIIQEYVDRQYAKAILGQTLSTESESGTFALARFQEKSQQHILEDDSLWQQEQLDRVIRTLVDLNFGPPESGRYPRFRIPYEEEKDMAAYLGAVSTAVNDLGLRVPEAWLRGQIGVPAPLAEEACLAGRSGEDKKPEIDPEEETDNKQPQDRGEEDGKAGA